MTSKQLVGHLLETDLDDPQHYTGDRLETWMQAFPRHGWQKWGGHSDRYDFFWKFEIPCRQGPPIKISAQHHYDTNLDCLPDARTRNVNMPDYISFQIGRERFNRFCIKPTEIARFLGVFTPLLKQLPPPRWEMLKVLRQAEAESGVTVYTGAECS